MKKDLKNDSKEINVKDKTSSVVKINKKIKWLLPTICCGVVAIVVVLVLVFGNTDTTERIDGRKVDLNHIKLSMSNDYKSFNNKPEDFAAVLVNDFNLNNVNVDSHSKCSSSDRNEEYCYKVKLDNKDTIYIVSNSENIIDKIIYDGFVIDTKYTGKVLGTIARLYINNLDGSKFENEINNTFLSEENLARDKGLSYVYSHMKFEWIRDGFTYQLIFSVSEYENQDTYKETDEYKTMYNEIMNKSNNTEKESNNSNSSSTNSNTNKSSNSSNSSSSTNNSSSNNSSSTNTNTTTNSSSVSVSKQNALRSAKDYLRSSEFSYEGLIHQLEYEKYSHEDAVYAVDNCGADWNEQALKSAKAYLRSSSFSYKGLLKQLEHEKFTSSQAKYGVDNCGADWNEQAVKSARDYLRSSSFSRQGLIDQLLYEGFTQSQAEYGVSQNGL